MIELEIKLCEMKNEELRLKIQLSDARQDFNESLKICGKQKISVENRLRELEKELQSAKVWQIKVGDGCTIHCCSDAEACTVIKRTAKTIAIQKDKAALNKEKSSLEFCPGGFACHVEGQQVHDYERNPKGSTMTLRWSDKHGSFMFDGKPITLGRHKFYDYDF